MRVRSGQRTRSTRRAASRSNTVDRQEALLKPEHAVHPLGLREGPLGGPAYHALRPLGLREGTLGESRTRKGGQALAHRDSTFQPLVHCDRTLDTDPRALSRERVGIDPTHVTVHRPRVASSHFSTSVLGGAVDTHSCFASARSKRWLGTRVHRSNRRPEALGQ
jgi:hypothetical protein